MGGNGAKEMQLEIAETSVGAGYMFPKKASQGMTNLKAVGWINTLTPTQYIDENFLMKIYFSNEVSYNKIQIVIDVH